MTNFLLASHRLGSFFGIETRIAYSVYFVAALFAVQYVNFAPAVALAALTLPLFVLAHEIGHSLVARHYGVFIESITLHALGGVSSIAGRIPSAGTELWIAGAGPAVSFAFAALGIGVGWYVDLHSDFWQLFTAYVGYQNFILALFNLLPIFPLDGGRIALALAVMIAGLERALKIVRPMTIVGTGFFVVWGLYDFTRGDAFGGIFMLLIAYLVWTQGAQEWQARAYAEQYAQEANWWNTSGWPGGRSANNWRFAAEKLAAKPAAESASGIASRFLARWQAAKKMKKEMAEAEFNRRIDDILRKVHQDGVAKLTAEERASLMKASEKYR
jgi:Zn-dependent protease